MRFSTAPFDQVRVVAMCRKPIRLELYLQEVQRRARRSLLEIEKMGTDAALDRCRELARQVQSQLSKLPDHTINIQSLADFQVSLERACYVLGQKSGYSAEEGSHHEP
jgi:hypothetical protein